MGVFTHLHCHTQYSLLDGAASVESLLKQTKELGMDSLAMTDHGNMFGIAHFVELSRKYDIKPIIGCEFYVAKDRFDRTDKKRYHQLLLAKNQIGYQNISFLNSKGFIEGYYYKPRIDKDLIKEHHEGIIATSCCLGSEVNNTLLNQGEEAAEKILLEWLDIFQDDYYLELQRFNDKEQEYCNSVLLKWAKKYNIKVIATNDVHYVKQEDSVAHDILLCIQTGKEYDDPTRMKFISNTFFLKSPENMLDSFNDLPHVIYNTQEIVDKIETPHLERDVLLPMFQVPEQFKTQAEYLEHLTWQGAYEHYKNITPELKERICYELEIITKMGFEGYFLIVQDYINAAKTLDVMVGPGRGSVCGSVLAYCLGITTIEPIRYGLFFERFLNPDRISMPDIDVDFEDNGRQKVIDYVANKYGYERVAHIITFGTMAAKMAIKDVARTLRLPLERANYLTKLIPDKSESLASTIKDNPELKKIFDDENSLEHKVLSIASTLEGSKRQSGIHACGMIIAPDDIIKYVPVRSDKGTDLLVTQYDCSIVEHVGLLKMDFLGLKTLTVIKNTLKMIKRNHNIDIDINAIPLDDSKTFELYQKGNTVGVFQFESEGMQQWLVKLKPTVIEDLIAMNALYRPGPMQFIPDFIDRKHGLQQIEYPHPLLEDVLKTTYGIIVYQEQVMKVAQIIAGYSLSQADILRKAMGKKKPEEMAKQKSIFIEGAKKCNNIPEKESTAIFEMMEKFAAYGFNKSHAAAYSIIAFQTAYLKAHYPNEYMTAVLTNEQTEITSLVKIINECKRMGLTILGPNINESILDFDINKNGDIQYGFNGIKGLGIVASEKIIQARNNGKFKDIYDFIKRIDLRSVNKKNLESLAFSGAFDTFNIHRRQFIYNESGTSFIENLISYMSKLTQTQNSLVNSLFGNEEFDIPLPIPPKCLPFSNEEKLQYEKEYIGFYASGHPLESYVIDMKFICNIDSQTWDDYKKPNKKVSFVGIVSKSTSKIAKNNKPYMFLTIEDFSGNIELSLFGNDYNKFSKYISIGKALYFNGEFVTKRYNENIEFKINSITYLNDIRTKYKSVKIKFKQDDITSELTDQIYQLISTNKGVSKFYIDVETNDNKYFSFLSRYYVNITDELIFLLKKYIMNIEITE